MAMNTPLLREVGKEGRLSESKALGTATQENARKILDLRNNGVYSQVEDLPKEVQDRFVNLEEGFVRKSALDAYYKVLPAHKYPDYNATIGTPVARFMKKIYAFFNRDSIHELVIGRLEQEARREAPLESIIESQRVILYDELLCGAFDKMRERLPDTADYINIEDRTQYEKNFKGDHIHYEAFIAGNHIYSRSGT